MRDDRRRLLDIVDAIAHIEKYTAVSRDAFEADELVQVWVVHHFQVIGEAAARLDREFQDSHSDIPWPEIIAMRNVIVHDYFGLDLDEVWASVHTDLPLLKEKVLALLG